MGIPGYVTSAIIGIILLAAVGIDVKWAKNRGKAVQKIYVNPALGTARAGAIASARQRLAFAQNDRLSTRRRSGSIRSKGRRMSSSIGRTGFTARTRDGNVIRFSGAELRTSRGVRPYRRPPARHAVRQGRKSDRRGRRHGRLRRQAEPATSSRSPTRPTAPGTS